MTGFAPSTGSTSGRVRGDPAHDAAGGGPHQGGEGDEPERPLGGPDEAEREEAGERARERAAVAGRDELGQERRHDGAFRTHADPADDAKAEEAMPVVDEGAGERGQAEQHQGPHHDVLAAVAVTQHAGEQRPDEEADGGARPEDASLDARQVPLRPEHRHQERDDGGVHRLEGVAEPSHHEQVEVEAAERQPFEPRCYH